MGVSNRGEREVSTVWMASESFQMKLEPANVGKFWEMTEALNQPIKLVTKQVISFQETNCVNACLIKCFYH